VKATLTESDDVDFPHLPDAVVEALDRMFPLRNPKLDDAIDSIRYRSGQRSVVETLLRIQAERRRLGAPAR